MLNLSQDAEADVAPAIAVLVVTCIIKFSFGRHIDLFSCCGITTRFGMG
jgi:hypothetical protein